MTRIADAQALDSVGGPELMWADTLLSRTNRGGVRGLHVRSEAWRLLCVAHGEIADVVVDIRPNSATPFRVVILRLSPEGDAQVVVPPGCAHGFQALSEEAEILLFSSRRSAAKEDGGICHDDADLAIEWPLAPFVDGPDAALPSLRDLLDGSAPRNDGVPAAGDAT